MKTEDSVINATTGTVIDTLAVGGCAVAVSDNGDQVYVVRDTFDTTFTIEVGEERALGIGEQQPRLQLSRSGVSSYVDGKRKLARAHGSDQFVFSGAAGNRTRVLRHSLKASPCAVRYVSTRISWSHELARMTIPVAV